jgi:uncharacterized membrane protein
MSELYVFAFDTLTGDPGIVEAIARLQTEGLIDLKDAALLINKPDGQAEVGQVTTLERSAVLSPQFWEGLARHIFPRPSMVLTLDDFEYTLVDNLTRTGPGDDFVRDVRETVEPGISALVLLVAEALPDHAMAELKTYRVKVLHASGPTGMEVFAELEESVSQGRHDDLSEAEEESDEYSFEGDLLADADLPGNDDFPGWG